MTSVSNQKRRRKLFVDCTILHRKYTENVDQKPKIKNPWKTSGKPLKNLWKTSGFWCSNIYEICRPKWDFQKPRHFSYIFDVILFVWTKNNKRMKTKNIQIVQIRTFRFKWCKIRKSPCASDLDKNINSWQNKKKSADWFVTQFDSWVPSYNYFLVLEHSVFTNKNAWQLLFYQKEKSEKKNYYEKKRSGKDENLKLIFF